MPSGSISALMIVSVSTAEAMSGMLRSPSRNAGVTGWSIYPISCAGTSTPNVSIAGNLKRSYAGLSAIIKIAITPTFLSNMTIMSRSGAEFWWGERLGHIIPPEVHHYWHDGYHPLSGQGIKWHIVTWSEVFKERTEKQLAREERKREPDFEIKPCYFWCFKNCITFPFGGWWSGIWTLTDYYDVRGKYANRTDLLEMITDLFNPGIIPFDGYETELYEALARRYPSNGFYKKPKRWPQALVRCYCRIEHGKVTDIYKHNPQKWSIKEMK